MLTIAHICAIILNELEQDLPAGGGEIHAKHKEEHKMNEKTIRELYLGKICPAGSRDFESETYKEHNNKFRKLYEEVENGLPDEIRKSLEAMIEEHDSARDEIVIDAFVKGFQLGMSLTAEGLRIGND